MIVLDTNVISEIVRREPNERVVAWLSDLTDDAAITAITIAELLAGVRRLPSGKRKALLSGAIDEALEPYRGTSAILSFDDRAAQECAEVFVAREQMGLPVHTADAQIAAICRVHGATCATRNGKDFEGTGVKLVNPWDVT